jgi:hypothetical protein
MDDAYFPAWTNQPMFTVSPRPRTDSFFRCPKYNLSIIRMKHFPHYRYIHGAHLGHQPKDAVGFFRPDHLIRLKIPYPVAKMGNTLGFFEPSFAFLQIPGQGMVGFLCALCFRDVLNGTE